MRYVRTTCWPAVLLIGLVACSDPGSNAASPPVSQPSPVVAPAVPMRADVPASMQACVECHAAVVETYLARHGMARSLGPAGATTPGVVVNPRSGNRYELVVDEEGAWLKGTTPGGGTRYQRLVGRIGAGLYDTSWIGMEVDPFTSEDTGRLFFAPVETITDQGLALSPFELHPDAAGLDMPLGEGCLTCHTRDDPARLPGAAVSPDGGTVYPSNALGADAFDHLSPLGCAACHGDGRRHVEMMSGLPDDSESLGFYPLRSAGQQRDVCAHCHLQGDARFELVDTPQPGAPLAGQIPVLVPVHTDDDFRFVGQVERLALSACFAASPEMTCTTCHNPHAGVAAQGTARFDAACKACHDPAPSHTMLTVEQVTGAPARTADGCVDCHVRRSEPFDLPHVRTADHFIRRRIPKPVQTGTHRAFADPTGPLTVFDDGRLADALDMPEGRRWQQGVEAMGLVVMNRMSEAVSGFDAFSPPGTPEAVQAAAPDVLLPLETHPTFHHMRGLALMAAGRLQEAEAAFSDALRLDPFYAGARVERLRLRLLAGDFQGALKDSDLVLEAHPKAEQPWNLRSTLALRIGSVAMAAKALEASTDLWASDAAAWRQLGGLYQELGQQEKARQAFERARALRPELFAPSQADAR